MCYDVTGYFHWIGRDRYYDFFYSMPDGTPETAGFVVQHQYLDGSIETFYTDEQAITKSRQDAANSIGVPITEICQYIPPCTPNWQVGAWEICQPDNTQTRTVTDLNNCGVDTDKPATTQSCVYVPPNNSAIIVIVAGIGLGILYFLTKNK